MYVRCLFLAWLASSLAVAAAFPGVGNLDDLNNIRLSADSEELAKRLANEYINFLRSGVESDALREITTYLAQSRNQSKSFSNKETNGLNSQDGFFLCTTCRAVTNVIVREFRDENGELNGPHNRGIVQKIVLEFCDRFDYQSQEVCSGLFESHWDMTEYMIYNSSIDSHTFCALVLDYGFCSINNPDYNFTLPIDQTGLPVTSSKGGLPPKSDKDLKILHITDIHYDPLYMPGSLAECDMPQCCQRHKDLAEGTNKAAGYWGDYRSCDSPWHLIEASLEAMQRTHTKLDYIYQTGDVVDHMVWATSREKNADQLSRVHNKIYELFPNVPVYHSIGNHEPHPLNAFSPDDVPEKVNTRWLYETLYEDWSRWLPPSTRETILRGGYYVTSPRPGFRVISLNNNDCYTKNWWLYHSGLDKVPQLQWLHDTLLEAEAAGDTVHILAHIPTGGGGCWPVWAREFHRIVVRFRHTIAALFNGHTHKDELNVFYTEAGHAVNVAWNGGSLTPFENNNPNYVVYDVEPERMQVVDYQTWMVNLSEANSFGAAQEPNWYHEYTFSEEFTTDLSPAGLDALLEQMASQPDLLRKFWQYQIVQADPRLNRGCARGCLLSTICGLAVTVSDQRQRCHELQAKLSIALDEETSSSTTTQSSTSTSTGTSTTPGDDDDDDDDDGATALQSLSFGFMLLLTFTVNRFVL